MKKYASSFFSICCSFLLIEYFAVHTLAKDSSTTDSYGGPLIRCIKSPLSKGSQNYYEDLSGCKDSANWTIASQSEQHFGESCGGPNAQSLQNRIKPLTS